jgi:hypothetical protein
MNQICTTYQTSMGQTTHGTTTCSNVASTSPAFIKGFSYGEVLQTTFLFFMFLIMLFDLFYRHFFGQKQKVPVARAISTNYAEGKIIEYD